MKTSAIIALSIVGVLGTAGGAMAVNGTTLASFNQGTIGQATDVLVPTPEPTDDANDDSSDVNGDQTSEPSESETDDDSGTVDDSVDAPDGTVDLSPSSERRARPEPVLPSRHPRCRCRHQLSRDPSRR